MKQYLLPRDGQFYKANLHCHSTISDGWLTPEQLRDAYKARGYSVLAITDHELMADHTALSTPDFLLLNGYEVYVKERLDDPRFAKNCHLNLIAKDPRQNKMICVDPAYIRYGEKNGLTAEELPRVGDMCHRRYGPRCVNCMIKTANENGYLVAYNHPSWSFESIQELSQCDGMYAMEVHNTGTTLEGFPGDDARVYDQLLRQGKRLYCLANDDNHNKYPLTSPRSDSFGGFNMIKANELTYGAIIAALEQGHFYASQGPEITELYAQDGKIFITCSDARRIHMVTGGRTPGRQYIAREGEWLREAEFDLKQDDMFFRIEVHDPCGNKAWTQAFDARPLLAAD